MNIALSGGSLSRLRDAWQGGYAIGAFTVYNLEFCMAVSLAAHDRGAPALLQAGSSGFAHAPRALLAATALSAAGTSMGRLGTHLDHSRSLEEIQWCLARGYTSVMFDGSKEVFASNVDLTRRAVRLARRYGAWIEGELGHIAGDENSSTGALPAGVTDPAQAEEFVLATGVDALAISVGNVHGKMDVTPTLRLDVLREIGRRVDVPLVLHGASGVSTDQLRAAVGLGISKVNFNADVRSAFLAALRRSPSESDNVSSVLSLAVDAMREIVGSKLDVIGATDQATR